MSATSYENVPVFHSRHRKDDPVAILGKAQVEMDVENGRTVITIEAGEDITEFLTVGTLNSFELSVAVHDVDTDKAKAYWSGRQR